MKMCSGSWGKTLAHVHAWLHSLEQQTLLYTNTQASTHTEVHWGEDTHAHTHTKENTDAASMQTVPAPRSETAKGLDTKCLSFHNNYPYRGGTCRSQTVFVFMCSCVCVWIKSACVSEGVIHATFILTEKAQTSHQCWSYCKWQNQSI